VELDEYRLRELLGSPLAGETVDHLFRALEEGREVRITSRDKPTMTIKTRFYFEKLLTNHFKWQNPPTGTPLYPLQ
jgi:hypothetical protein